MEALFLLSCSEASLVTEPKKEQILRHEVFVIPFDFSHVALKS